MFIKTNVVFFFVFQCHDLGFLTNIFIFLDFMERLIAKILATNRRNIRSWQENQNYPRSWKRNQDAKHWVHTRIAFSLKYNYITTCKLTVQLEMVIQFHHHSRIKSS